ncbi:uncharacterized protein TNCT_232231 [Trichonephila clavata]|uniref:Uncharacterized protein n=1 Tax=Trichonephila clavata TaxID=2740835 RepID=A0A8X6F008_TRICU|nr:uncharacterized protein TNCT_232231 [Trichonephila clavata]
MTFPISNSEKIVITLSSEKADKPENASSFGKIMVHMDDKSCEIFSKYLKELEKEPRISKVVEAAKSFVEEKNGKQVSHLVFWKKSVHSSALTAVIITKVLTIIILHCCM